MRHRKQKVTLGREAASRGALLRNLAESLILHGSIETTQAKAKALRVFVEPLVTKGKKGTLAARRELMKVLYTQAAVKKMMSDLAPKYMERPGGYTRIIKTQPRVQDGAEMARIEFV